MEDRVSEIAYLRSKMERVLHERQVMSLVRQEYLVQGAQAEVQRTAESIKLEN